MPIVVSHQPDQNLLFRAGYQSGAGEYMKWQEEMAQRERMQTRALQSNMLSQQIANDNALNRMSYGAMLDERRSNQAMAHESKLRKELAEMDAQSRMEYLTQQMEDRRNLELMERETAANADVIKFLMGTSKDLVDNINGLLAEGYEFEDGEAGLKRWNDTLKTLDALKRDPTVSGLAVAQGTFAKLMQAGVPKVKKPSFQDNLEQMIGRTKASDGRELMLAPVREVQVLDDGKADKNAAEEPAVPMSPMERFYADKDFAKELVKLAPQTKQVPFKDGESGEQKYREESLTPEESAQWMFRFLKMFDEQTGKTQKTKKSTTKSSPILFDEILGGGKPKPADVQFIYDPETQDFGPAR